MDVAACLSYVFVSTVTPGPNNMVSMSGAAQNGFAYSLRYTTGVFIGFFALGLLAGGFTAMLYDVLPAIEPWLLALGSAYILYLAWQVWRSKPGESGEAGKSRGVLTGILMQAVNVKGILFAVTGMASYVLPHYRDLPHLALCSAVMAASCFVCCCIWALFGSVLVGAYRKHTKIVNGVMALALVWCAADLIIDLIGGLIQ